MRRLLGILVGISFMAACSGPSATPVAVTVTQTITATPSTTAGAWSDEANAIHIGNAPAFPSLLPGWTLAGSWTDLPRAFNNQWTAASGPNHDSFPATMNGCDQQRFLVRWRVLASGATVRASWQHDTAPDQITGDVLNGHSGWFSLDGCQIPKFQLYQSTSGSTLGDVTVEVQQFSPAP